MDQDLLRRAAAAAGMHPFAAIVHRIDAAGSSARIAPDAGFYPASMIKTPLAAAVFALAAEGELALDSRYEISPANMTLNDMPSPLVPGYRAALSELVELMITRSDNVATNVLFDVVGRERATARVQQRFGLRGTAFHRKLSGALPLIHDAEWDGVHLNTHPPADAAQLFEQIARERVPMAGSLRDVLLRQQWNNKLSAGLQAGDRFAHKTGDTDEVTHDGGILELPGGATYVIVVYTGMPSSDENNARFGRFMSALRSELQPQ